MSMHTICVRDKVEQCGHGRNGPERQLLLFSGWSDSVTHRQRCLQQRENSSR